MAIERVPHRYAVRPGGRLPGGDAAAQMVGEELDAIAAEQGGISAAAVVERAATPGTALHEWDSRVHWFESDDAVAAQKFREEQARLLIRAVVIKVESGDQTLSTRGFYTVEGDDRVKEYQPIDRIVVDAEASRKIRDRFQNELIRLDEHYRAYLAYADFAQHYSPLFEVVDKVIDEAAAEGNVRAQSRQRFRRRAGHVQLTEEASTAT